MKSEIHSPQLEALANRWGIDPRPPSGKTVWAELPVVGAFRNEQPRDGRTAVIPAYVAAAVAHQVERDNLTDLIAVAEAEHGPITDEEIQAKRDQLQRAREQQRRS